MNADVMKYLGIIGGLIFVYLVIVNASCSTSVINGISKANTNMIMALQGRQPGAF